MNHHHQQCQHRQKRKRTETIQTKTTSTTSTTSRRSMMDEEEDVDTILKGVMVSLSGFTPDEKDAYHAIIVQLGGHSTRTLNLCHLDKDNETDLDVTDPKNDNDSKNTTHLITRTASGPKYEAAVSFNRSMDSKCNCDQQQQQQHHHPRRRTVWIVRPSWLDACVQQQRRVDERLHAVVPPLLLEDEEQENDPNDPNAHSALDACHGRIMAYPYPSFLFSACHFYLMGFEEKDEDEDFDNDKNLDHDHAHMRRRRRTNHKDVRNQLCQIIRWGMGTIYWNLYDHRFMDDDHEDSSITDTAVTHVIVRDGADPAKTLHEHALYHYRSNDPPFVVVSPSWLIRSVERGILANAARFPPQYNGHKRIEASTVEPSSSSSTSSQNVQTTDMTITAPTALPSASAKTTTITQTDPTACTSSSARLSTTTADTNAATTTTAPSISRSSSLFRDVLFCLLRAAPPPAPAAAAAKNHHTVVQTTAVDFDATRIEADIGRHGGTLLTPSLAEALQQQDDYDSSSSSSSSSSAIQKKTRPQEPKSKRQPKRQRQRRTCYVIAWGGVNAHDAYTHPVVKRVMPPLQHERPRPRPPPPRPGASLRQGASSTPSNTHHAGSAVLSLSQWMMMNNNNNNHENDHDHGNGGSTSGCQVLFATPVWLQTCIVEQRVIPVTHWPALFVPGKRPWYTLSTPTVAVAVAAPAVVTTAANANQRVKQQIHEVESRSGVSVRTTRSSHRNTSDGKDPTEDRVPLKELPQASSSSSSFTSHPPPPPPPPPPPAPMKKIRIALTGFVGWRRTALIQIIAALGVPYDDALQRNKTTHLICCSSTTTATHTHTNPNPNTAANTNKKPTTRRMRMIIPNTVVRVANSDKYVRAVQWQMHTVSVDWLLHVMHYGLRGGNNDSRCSTTVEMDMGGCELNFPVTGIDDA